MKLIVNVIIAVALLLIAVIVLTNLTRSRLFFPDKYPSGTWDTAHFHPRPEDVWFETSDGKRLHGWHFEADAPLAMLIWSHGNAGNISYRADAAADLARQRISVFLYDYRGYGRSEGRPSEGALYLDSEAAWDAMRARTDLPIALYGESIGGPYAAWVAAEREGACALVLESSFPSVREAAGAIYSPLRVDLIVYDGLRTAEFAQRAAVPTLIMHSRQDTILPSRLGARLEELIPDSELVLFELSGHATIAWDEREKWLETVTMFLREHCEDGS